MNLLKSIALSIGWLSGSLAGLGAILYAFGYLVIRAQLRLLGIDNLFGHSPDQFIQEGARFFMVVGELLIQTLLVATLALALAALLLGIVYLPVRWAFGARLTRFARFFASLNDRLVTIHRRLPWPPAASWYGLLLCLLFLHFLTYRRRFTLPLELSNVLYTAVTTSTAAKAAEGDIWNSLLAANATPLHTYFVGLVFAEIHVAILLVTAWRLTSRLSLRLWLIAPFVATMALYTLYLPMAYGVLARPTRYNRVTLHFGADAAPAKSGAFFLLSKTDHEFIVWDADLKKVLWIPKGAVAHAEIMQVEHLFKKGGGQP